MISPFFILQNLSLGLGGFHLFRLRAALHSRQSRVRDDLRYQVNRPNGVIITRNDIIDLVGIAVGIDNRDDRDTRPARFRYRYLLFSSLPFFAAKLSVWSINTTAQTREIQ